MNIPAFDVQALQNAIQSLQHQQESIRRERAELDALKRAARDTIDKFRHRVKLNVGGRKYETTLSTLTRYPTSMLGTMFSGREGIDVPTDEDGCVFIDRDGTHFGAILNFLRGGEMEFPEHELATRELMREIKFYMLEDALQEASRTTPPSLEPHAQTDTCLDQVHKKLLQMDFAFLGLLPLTKGGGRPENVVCGVPNPGAFMVADLQPQQSVVIYVVATFQPSRGKGDHCVTGSNPYMAGSHLSACCQHAFGSAFGWIRVTRTANMSFSGIASQQNGVSSRIYEDSNCWGSQIWFELHAAGPGEIPALKAQSLLHLLHQRLTAT